MTVFLWQKIVVIASDARGSQSLIWESCESQRFDVINEKSGQVVPEPSSQWPPNPWSDATRSTSTPTVHAVIARETEQTLSCRLYIPAMTGECPLLRSLHSAVQLYPADSFRCPLRRSSSPKPLTRRRGALGSGPFVPSPLAFACESSAHEQNFSPVGATWM